MWRQATENAAESMTRGTRAARTGGGNGGQGRGQGGGGADLWAGEASGGHSDEPPF